MKEIWKPIVDEDVQARYAVSNYGQVIDIKNNKKMLCHDNGAGYMSVGFPRTTISSVFNGRSNWELFEFAREEIANQLLTSPQNAL